jgi:hypothetical protein
LNSGDRITIATLELEIRLTAEEGNDKERETDEAGYSAPVRPAAFQDVFTGRVPPSRPPTSSAPTQPARETSLRQAEIERPRAEIEWDRVDLLMLAAVGPLLVVALSFFFPVESWSMLWQSPRWLWWRSMCSLDNLWLRWGIAGFLAALTAVFCIRARKDP